MALGLKKQSSKGFTVLEVLIVLVIVGVLAAIAIPRMVSSSDATKRNVCYSNIDLINRQIEL
jgi:prepilin-type N-terminal cleavage/methylation domain-containing protein